MSVAKKPQSGVIRSRGDAAPHSDDGGAKADRVHPLLRQRFSPASFDQRHQMTCVDVVQLVEAARWAPSAGNAQPWLFLPLLRGSTDHERVLPLLAPSSRTWASQASLLVLNMCRRHVAGSDILYSDFSDYDLGQAVAHMTLQAQAMGLASRQFRAFDQERVTREFSLPEDCELLTMTAIGKAVQAPAESRSRRRLSDVIAVPTRPTSAQHADDGPRPPE